MERAYKYLSEFKEGEVYTTLSKTITETDVILFAGITGDMNPIHTDKVYAESLPFKSRLAHGLLGAGIATGLWGRMGLVDGSSIAALNTHWEFVGPIKIGDTVHCEVTVSGVKQSHSKPDRGVLTLDYKIINQDGNVCQTGGMSTMMWWAEQQEA